MKLDVLVPASPARVVTGRALHIAEPISFWGGVSPTDGALVGSHRSQHGKTVSGRVLLVRELRGSSSGSSVLLELIYKDIAPSAIILPEADAILALGALVAREMEWRTPAIFRWPVARQVTVPEDALLSIAPDGEIDGLDQPSAERAR